MNSKLKDIVERGYFSCNSTVYIFIYVPNFKLI